MRFDYLFTNFRCYQPKCHFIIPTPYELASQISNAIINGELNNIESLLQQGADPNTKVINYTPHRKDTAMETLLHYNKDSLETKVLIAQMLLDYGANRFLNTSFHKNYDASAYETASTEYPTLFKIFLESLHTSEERINAELSKSLFKIDDPKIMKELLELGADPNAVDQEEHIGLTILTNAVLQLPYGCVKALIEAGADPTLRVDTRFYTPKEAVNAREDNMINNSWKKYNETDISVEGVELLIDEAIRELLISNRDRSGQSTSETRNRRRQNTSETRGRAGQSTSERNNRGPRL